MTHESYRAMGKHIAPLEINVHDKLMNEVNDASIAIKLWHDPQIERLDVDQQNKIIKARSNRKEPQWEDMIELLDKVHKELSKCRTQPRRRY